MRYLPWFSSSGKVKAEAKRKERREHAGNADRAITTTETPRMTKRTTAGRMAEHGRIRKAARLAKMQAQEWTQARAIGTTGRTTFGARQPGKARAKVRSKVSICSVDEAQVGAVRRITARLTADDEIHFCMVSGEQCATSTM